MNLMKYKGNLIEPEKLRTAVEQHGGYALVEARRNWTLVRKFLGLPHSTSGGNTIRRAYIRYFPTNIPISSTKSTKRSSNVYIRPSPSLRAPSPLQPSLPAKKYRQKRRVFPGRILVGNFMGVRSYVVMVNHENKYFVTKKQVKNFHQALLARRKLKGKKIKNF